MNIDGDYLWDRTGEPDPEVQQLEEVLGTLRYQPRPLKIPAELRPSGRRNFFAGLARGFAPRLALAATIMIALLGLGLWLGLQRRQQPPTPALAGTEKPPALNNPSQVGSSPNGKQSNSETVTVTAANQPTAGDPVTNRFNPGYPDQTARRARENRRRAELALQRGRAAKDQLMLALRLASAKLNFAQKKTQGLNPREPVHNQHPIG